MPRLGFRQRGALGRLHYIRLVWPSVYRLRASCPIDLAAKAVSHRGCFIRNRIAPCSIESFFYLFLIARVIQALGGGGIFIIASSYVLSKFPAQRQGTALGLLGGMNGIAAILGPNIGAFILDITGNWHWLFLINVPIAILLFLAGIRYIQEEQELSRAAVDWSGIAVLTAGVLSLMYSFSNLDGVNMLQSLASPMFYSFFIVGIAVLVLFYFMEKGWKGPTVNRSFLRNCWALRPSAGRCSLPFLRSHPGLCYFHSWLCRAISRRIEHIFRLLVYTSCAGLRNWSGWGGYLVDRKGPIWTLSVAGLLSAIGFLLFPLWVEHIWQFVIASTLVGIGFGMMLGAPVNVLVTEQAGENNKGIAVATSSLFRQMAMAIAPTIFAGFLARSFLTWVRTSSQVWQIEELKFRLPRWSNMLLVARREMMSLV